MPTTDAIALSFSAVWQTLCPAVADTWVRDADGILTASSPVPIPTLNGAWALDPAVSGAALAERWATVADRGVPCSLQLREGIVLPPSLAGDGRLVAQTPTPLMVLDTVDSLVAPTPTIEIRRLAVEEIDRHVAVVAAGFDAPVELMREFMTPAVAALPEVRLYVGTVDGVDVTTGMGAIVDGVVGVFNIGTPAEHRGKGYGTTVTAEIVRDAAREGVTAAWLQSSEAGYNVYESLGFVTRERWSCWFANV